MSVITVAYTVVAVGNVLWRLAGQDGLPPVIGDGMALWGRLATLTKSGRRNATLKRSIEDALDSAEFNTADEADVSAADKAVARVLADASTDQKLMAAVRDQARLHNLLADKAGVERTALISEPAQAVFDLVLRATEKFLVRTACESPDFANLAHREELQDLADLADEIHKVSALLQRIPAETVRLFAGRVLSLDSPVTPKGFAIEPSRLLVPTSSAFPFVDRSGLLEDLVAWVDDPAPFGVRIVGGLGGSGKSRLAVELCRRLVSEHGAYWKAGYLGSDVTEAALSTLAMEPGGRLVVLDYAETRGLDVAAVVTSLQDCATSLQPVRVLLLVRNPAASPVGVKLPADDPEPWRSAVRPVKDEAANSVLDEASFTILSSDPLTVGDRERLFLAAVEQLPAYLGLQAEATIEPGELDFLGNDEFDQPLHVAMAAYLFVVGDRTVAHGQIALFEGVLKHEAEYWRHIATSPTIDLALTEPELRFLVALATLTDVADDDEVLEVLGRVDFLQGDANALLRGRANLWLNQLYTSDEGRWGPLVPDRLGEYVVASLLTDRPELIRAALSPTRDSAQLLRPLRTLGRACAEHPNLAVIVAAVLNAVLLPLSKLSRDLAGIADPWGSATFIEALAGLVDAVGHRCLPERLTASSLVLGLGNRLTLPMCLAVDRAAIDAIDPGLNSATLADSLNNYAIRLVENGQRAEALGPAFKAVALRRVLAKVNPVDFTPDLASSLNNYANTLVENGQPMAALVPALEAITLRRVLAKVNPAAFTAALAMSLTTYAVSLAATGQREEALVPAREAVDAYLILARIDFAAYIPALAMSLNNYAVRLSAVGQRGEALVPARQAVEIRRELARVSPAAYTADLASSLNNYANILAENGQLVDALIPAFEAVEIYRVLAGVNPAAYFPDLAMSLNNYAISLSENGQRGEALVPAFEAVEAYRVLTQVNRSAYIPDLAMALTNYAVRLGENGQRMEALVPVREAVDAYRALAQDNRAAFGFRLRDSLATLAEALFSLGRFDDATLIRAEMDSMHEG